MKRYPFYKRNVTTGAVTEHRAIDKPVWGLGHIREQDGSPDIFIDGKWYSSINDIAGTEIVPDTVYTDSITYLPELVNIDDQGNVLSKEAYNQPTLVEDVVQVRKVIQTQNRKIIELGTIYNNNRYVVENPFGNENYEDCDVKVEVYVNNMWSETGIGNNTGTGTYGSGVGGFSNLEGIVIQTGQSTVYADSNRLIGGHGTSVSATSALARIIVTYQGDAR